MNEKDNLIKEAEHIITFYGQQTVAADFAREVLKFLQNPAVNVNICEIDPDFPYGSYTHTLSVDELPKHSMSINPSYTWKKLEPKDE